MREPFSRVVLARDIPPAGKQYRIEANEAERRELAEALELAEIVQLGADLWIRPQAGSGFSLRGTLKAVVVQTDVVTLDRVQQDVAEHIELSLMPAEESASKHGAGEPILDSADTEAADLFLNGRIDVGAIVAEHLALGLDPYPRAPGTEFDGYVEDDSTADPSPFASLAALKKSGE